MRLPSTAALCAAILCALPGAALAQTKLLRFPDLHGDRAVFTYAGDLWTAPVAGGTATRLTAHQGLELFAKFSPDGKWIAFTGQYDGDEQIYVMPSTGGVPKQLTYYPARGPLPPRWGYDNQVYGWTPDGSAILFRSLREGFAPGDSRLYTVPVAGGLPVALPMPTSGGGDLSPDGKKVLYSPLARDFRSWKRYQGGWAQDLYVFDTTTRGIEPVAHHPRSERDPMWIGEKMYFASDRTGTLNLYEWDPKAKKVRPLTSYTDWDVRWPSRANDERIVFELDGELHVISTKPGSKAAKIRISVPDDGVHSRPSMVSAAGHIEGFDLSPKGERALFAARGEIFTAPIEKGVPRNLTRSPGAHDKAAEWSPDGRRVAYISDASGEEELYVVAQEGSAPAVQLTNNGKAMRYRPTWSPDSKSIAISDKDGRLQVVRVDDKSVVDVADESRGQLLDYVWSPDSAWLAFSMSGAYDGNNAIYLWNAAEKKLTRVTDEFFNAFGPSWDPDGNYLYYISDREYAPLISNVEWNFAGARNRSLYALALRKDVKNPFPPESDEVTIEAEKKPEEKKADDKKAVRIDLEGLGERVTRVPVQAHNYGGVIAVKGHLLYSRASNFYYGRQPDSPPSLVIFDIKARKETVLAEGMSGFAVSFDGAKVLVRQGANFNLHDAKPSGKDGKKAVATAGLMAERSPSQEWAQIFNEVWRRYRDFFYVPNMHGYDWEALRRQYAPMLEYVGHRSDLNYVISEMISELNVGHAYIEGGELNMPPRPRVALPGARFELDSAAGRYKISEIFRGQNQEPEYRSPLTEVGVDVRVGDYVLAIDGEELSAATNPYRLLRGKADRQVRMTVNSTPDRNGAREVVFQPISSESNLLYLAWVEKNRAAVDRMTGGRVGYLHVPNMAAEGIREFIKWFYPQMRKEGLVIDMRGNGGGNVSSMLIERLRRELLATGFSRTNDHANTYPQTVFHGHLVCLLSETSASDGDIFPAMFKQAKLGPLVGKRSWGGVVGITNRGTLMDGGSVSVPEFGFASTDGKWIIEGLGVEPDIVVENDPKSVLDGKDSQLERGVAEVLARIKANPKRLPSRPAPPVKTKEAPATN